MNDRYVVLAKGMSVFKASGGMNYVHGGSSPRNFWCLVCLSAQRQDIGNNDEELLHISSGSAYGVGKVTPEGFVVLQGARLNEKLSAKSLSNGIVKLREKWMADEKVKDWVTTEDLLFSSSSAAADFVLGYSVSGPRVWKNADGKSLKEIEAEQDH